MSLVKTMNHEQLITDYVKTFNEHHVEALAAFLAEDFVFDAEPPLNAAQFLGVLQIVHNAFPDNTMCLQLDKLEGNQATLLFNNSGTHTSDLDLTMLGGTIIPPTGKTFKLPEGIFDYILGDGGITAVHPRPNPGGGFQGILSQLGISR